MAEDSIRIKNLPDVKPEPERGEVLVTDGSETNGLESDYLCNLEDNFGGRFRENVQYKVNDTCIYHGKRWKFIREHEGPFDTDDVVWAQMSSPYEIWVAEYGVTAAYFMAVAVQEGFEVCSRKRRKIQHDGQSVGFQVGRWPLDAFGSCADERFRTPDSYCRCLERIHR